MTFFKMIIGLTGTKASGKGIVAEILKEKGFEYSSTSDRVREEAIKRGLMNYTTKDLQDIGNDLREKYGVGILAQLTLKKLKDKENIVIDSIRNPGEIEELKKKNAKIIAVDAPQEIRFKRIIERKRDSDPKDWESFLQMENRDLGVGESSLGQQVSKCMEISDFKIENNDSLETLKTKVEYILIKLEDNIKVGKRKDYLSWDEYFMGIALLSAQRSKDPNTQVGACIVNEDKKIVATGYNGFPTGCSDDNLPWAREGEFLQTKYPYVCHAELNAILNATVSLKNSTIYVALFPCNECAKAIIQAGIKEVVYLSDKYENTDSTKAAKKLFSQAGIRIRQIISSKKQIQINFS